MNADAASRFHARIVDEHIDELGFLLHLRQSRLPYAAGDVHEWLAFDRRVAAHIDGLLLRTPLAWPRLIEAAWARPRVASLRLAGILALNAEGPAPAHEWLLLAAREARAAPWADEVTRWILPERRAAAAAALLASTAAGDHRCALSIELNNLLKGSAASWPVLLREVAVTGGDLALTARALSRISDADAASPLALLRDHPSAAVRQGAVCALLGLPGADTAPPPVGWDAAEVPSLEPLVPVRAALRHPDAEPERQIGRLWQQGRTIACALTAAAIGTARMLPVLVRLMSDAAAAPLAERAFASLTGWTPVAPEAESAARWLAGPGSQLPAELPLLHGSVRDDIRCRQAMRQGDALERLVCAEVLAASNPGFVPPDVLAPMYEQLRQVAMSTPASTAPAPAH